MESCPQLRRTGHLDRARRARWASLAPFQRRPSLHGGLHTVRSVVMASCYQSGEGGTALAVRFDRPLEGQHATSLCLSSSLSPQPAPTHSLTPRPFTSPPPPTLL